MILPRLPPPLRSKARMRRRRPAIPNGHVLVIVPTMFPLPPLHGLPMGQVWSPTVGPDRFLQTIATMSEGASGTTIASVSWAEKSPALRAWLTAVAAAPDQFAVKFVARVDVASALVAGGAEYPDVSKHALEPFTWIDTGVARRLHRDGILARFPETNVRSFSQWEELAHDSILRSAEPRFFGPTTIPSMAALWRLRPPATSNWRGKFGLDSFLDDEASSPQLSEFRIVKVFVSKKNEKVLPLETIDEFEEREADMHPSPASTAVKRRMTLEASRLGVVSGTPSRPAKRVTHADGIPACEAGTAKEPITMDSMWSPNAGGPHRQNLGNAFEQAASFAALPPAAPPVAPAQGPPPSVFAAIGAAHSAPPTAAAQPPLYSQAQSTAPAFRGAPNPFAAANLGSFGGSTLAPKANSVEGWKYTSTEQDAPAPYCFFAKLQTYSAPCRGISTTGVPISDVWWEQGLRPAALNHAWCREFLGSDRSGVTAATWIQRQHYHGRSRYAMRGFGTKFFEGEVFKSFTEGRTWRADVMTMGAAPSGFFTPLHFLLLLPDFDAPRFPAQGMSREEFENFVRTVSRFFEMSCRSNEPDDYSDLDPHFDASPLQLGLKSLLFLLDLNVMRRDWPRHQMKLTALFYSAFEELFEVLLAWIACHYGKRVAAEVSTRDASDLIVLLNPAINAHGVVHQPTLLGAFQAWQRTQSDRFKHNFAAAPFFHSSYELPPIFAADAKPAAAPAAASGSTRSGKSRKPKSTTTESAASEGEQSSRVFRNAKTPALCFANGKPDTGLGLYLRDLHPPKLDLPNDQDKTPAMICFDFSTEGAKGCDGQRWDKNSRKRVTCDRIHLDLAGTAGDAIPAAPLKALATWLDTDAVKEKFVATTALKEKIDKA